MALTFTRRGDTAYRIVGAQKETITDVLFDSSYPTGGEAVTAAELGLNRVETATAVVQGIASGSVNVTSADYDETNAKILLYDETPAEVANTSDMSGTTVRVIARGY